MKSQAESKALLSVLAERNTQLTQLSKLFIKYDKDIRKSIETESRKVEKTLKRLDLELNTGKITPEEERDARDKKKKILAMKEKYDYARALRYPNIMKKCVLQYAAEKRKKSDAPWLQEAKAIMHRVNTIDKKYTAEYASVLNAFLGKEGSTLKELNDYCVSHDFSDGQRIEEHKTGLLFALATLDLALTPEYLINLTVLTVPNITTQKETIDHLTQAITDKSVEPLIKNYNAMKKDNPITAIATLVEGLRMHITFPDNKLDGGGEFYLKAAKVNVNEAALRIIYYRECMAAGIAPAKINDIFITEQSVLRAHQPSPKTKHADSIETMGLFAHKDTPASVSQHTDSAAPRQKK